MNARLFAGALALLLIGGAVPSVAYHIDNALGPAPNFAPLSSGDFEAAGVGTGFILCEREFGTGTGATPGVYGPASDDRNSDPGLPNGGPGFGGLCTTGRNDATGLPAPLVAPAPKTYTRLDACNAITSARNGGGFGPYLPTVPDPNGAGEPCAGTFTPTADTDDHQWFFELGAYACTIPTTDAVATLLGINNNYAAYYDEHYAWFSFDGDGSYTPGDPNFVPHSGDGPNPPEPGALGVLDNVDAWHGHATMFIEAAGNQPGFSSTGSAETAPGAAGSIGGAGVLWRVSGMPDGLRYDSSCGGSPGLNTALTAGSAGAPGNNPVWRACYDADPVFGCLGTVPSDIPACSDVWIGPLGFRATFACLTPCGPLPGWAMAITVVDGQPPVTPPASGATVDGTLTCPGGSVFGPNTCAATTDIVVGSVGECPFTALALVGGVPTCLRSGGTLPTTPDNSWLVVCVPDP